MRGSARLLVISLAMMMAVANLHAADTGTVSGAVFDQNGQPVVDAAVKISGVHLPVGRTAQTGANGLYHFEYLLPGEYAIEIDKAGLERSRRTALVEVGRDTQIDFVIGLAVREEVIVTAAAAPIVDVRSTEVSFNYTADALNVLPLERTYRGLFQLIPGVADNRSPSGPAAGGSRQDNTYLMDGANITNPAFGYLSTEVNELDIAEINLKRAGISAEFGRTSGTVTNAVSRSGSNRFAGIGRIDWLPTALVGSFRLPQELVTAGVKPGAFRDLLLTSEIGPAAGLGGPIVKDRVFFYGSARYFRDTKWDRFNKISTPLPDEVRMGTEALRQAHRDAGDEPSDGGQLSPPPESHRQRRSQLGFRAEHRRRPITAVASRPSSGRIYGRQPLAQRAIPLHERSTKTCPSRISGALPPFDRYPVGDGAIHRSRPGEPGDGGTAYSNSQNYRPHEVRGTISQFSTSAEPATR